MIAQAGKAMKKLKFFQSFIPPAIHSNYKLVFQVLALGYHLAQIAKSKFLVSTLGIYVLNVYTLEDWPIVNRGIR